MEKIKITQEQADAIETYLRTHDSGRDGIINAHARHCREAPEQTASWGHPYESLNNLLASQLSRAVHVGYEIEPEFKYKEWIAYKRVNGTTVIAKIIEVEHGDNSVLTDYKVAGLNQRFYFPSIRHATPSEIAEEKERRWWEKHGRKPWELREYDLLHCMGEEYVEIVYKADSSVQFKDGECHSWKYIKENYRVSSFAESRLDVKTNEI